MKILTTIALSIFAISSYAQADKFVKWTAKYDAASSAILLTADLTDDWVIYSQHTDPEGPIPLEFEFIASEGIEYLGKVEELTKPIVKMSEMFGVEVMKFKKSAKFRQQIKGYKAGTLLKGNVTFMTCDSQKCLPPETIPFEVKL